VGRGHGPHGPTRGGTVARAARRACSAPTRRWSSTPRAPPATARCRRTNHARRHSTYRAARDRPAPAAPVSRDPL